MENSAMNDQHQANPSHFMILIIGMLSLLFTYDFLYPHPETLIPKQANREKRNVIIIDDRNQKEKPVVTELIPAIQDEPVEMNVDTTSDSAYFESLLSKTNLTRKHDVIIRYYAKPLDSSRVYSLRQFGYYIHERPIEDRYEKFASNAICYGDSVQTEEVLRVAYILMKKGLVLQNISLSKYHDDWKNHAIEIGTDTTALSKRTISLAELRNRRFDW